MIILGHEFTYSVLALQLGYITFISYVATVIQVSSHVSTEGGIDDVHLVVGLPNGKHITAKMKLYLP